jgi:NAD(P)H-dependent FMN reductase
MTRQPNLERRTMSDLKIGIILGSTRPGRKGEQIARWVLEQANLRTDASYELIDLADYRLPHLDEAVPASFGQYANAHTKVWAEKIDSLDGFVFVTPEYNHGTSGALKNAIDFLYAEWNNKAAGLISYGSSGGFRAAEHLRLILGELQIADVRAQLAVSLRQDFENFTTFVPTSAHAASLGTVLTQVNSWSRALRGVREEQLKAAA